MTSTKDNRAQLMARHPELKEALEQLSASEFQALMAAFHRLAAGIESARGQLQNTRNSLTQKDKPDAETVH